MLIPYLVSEKGWHAVYVMISKLKGLQKWLPALFIEIRILACMNFSSGLFLKNGTTQKYVNFKSKSIILVAKNYTRIIMLTIYLTQKIDLSTKFSKIVKCALTPPPPNNIGVLLQNYHGVGLVNNYNTFFYLRSRAPQHCG